MKLDLPLGVCLLATMGAGVCAKEPPAMVSDTVVMQQQQNLEKATAQQGFGPQSPRDLTMPEGNNPLMFSTAPPPSRMNLCNIHFHKNAEHKGGEFTTYAGNGDGKGNESGYLYSGTLTAQEKTPLAQAVCQSDEGSLQAGDTIEVHYVYSTAQVKPGPTLGACLSEAIKNPQLRVEAQVFVLVNDGNAANFADLMRVGEHHGYQQALALPTSTGTPITYAGSTTGPNYNEKGSPFQVSWSVRPKVLKVNGTTVGQWCANNVFHETHAHGVRNLVKSPQLLSRIDN